MSKVKLKDDTWIIGLKSETQLHTSVPIIHKHHDIIYQGKTSEISEELAKECVIWNHKVISTTSLKTGSGQTYKDYTGESMWYIYSASESIRKACPEEYCIIYKTEDNCDGMVDWRETQI